MIAVHALKSNSKGVGAEELGELALALEMAGKEGRFDYISDHHDEMMEQHDALLKMLSENSFVCPGGNAQGDENKADTGVAETEGSAASPADLIASLSEKLDGFEGEGIDELLHALEQCNLPDGTEPFSAVAEQIREKVNDFDFLGASEVLSAWEQERKGTVH